MDRDTDQALSGTDGGLVVVRLTRFELEMIEAMAKARGLAPGELMTSVLSRALDQIADEAVELPVGADEVGH